MRILYDYQTFQMQRYGGISNSFVNLMKNLPPDIDYQIGIKDSDNVHLKENHLVAVGSMKTLDSYFGKNSYRGKGHLNKMARTLFPSLESDYKNRHYSEKLLANGNYDVFHPTYFDDYFLPFLGEKPFVLTVHDMIPELLHLNDPLQIAWKKELVPLASHIVAVSHQTKHDLMELMDVPESKITVIYHGAPEKIEPKAVMPEGLKYFLYVGRRDVYKGFQTMVSALAPILKAGQMHLVCTGPEFSDEERLYLRGLGIENQVKSIRANDQEMQGLYAHAQCFIFPSFYEGFGIPILEAYQANCPVVLNHASCFPEIAGDAAVYFSISQDGSTDLYDVMCRFLLWSDQQRDALLEKQRARLALFSWKKSAEQLAAVYRKVIQ